MRINQLHWSDNIQHVLHVRVCSPECAHVQVCVHMCTCLHRFFYANWKSQTVSNWSASSLRSCLVSLEVHNVDSSSSRGVFLIQWLSQLLTFSRSGFWSFPFFCQLGNFSAQPYKYTGNHRYAQLPKQTYKTQTDTCSQTLPQVVFQHSEKERK